MWHLRQAFIPWLRITGGVAVLALSGLVPPLASAAMAADDGGVPIPCEAIDSVGTAKMSEDGTITLRLRTLWPQPFAESEHAYAPGDPHYGSVQRHLGGIAPGQTKPVPPLCATNSEP